MRASNTSRKFVFAGVELLGKVGSKQSYVLSPGITLNRGIHRQHRRKSRDVVATENSLNFRQISFIQECAVGGRLDIHSANFNVKGIFLWGNDKVGADRPQLAADFVADIGGNRDHRRSDGYAESDGSAR